MYKDREAVIRKDLRGFPAGLGVLLGKVSHKHTLPYTHLIRKRVLITLTEVSILHPCMKNSFEITDNLQLPKPKGGWTWRTLSKNFLQVKEPARGKGIARKGKSFSKLHANLSKNLLHNGMVVLYQMILAVAVFIITETSILSSRLNATRYYI
jgi:hypothetical protein